ncbi:MAG: carbohydrate-binding domain-containing protein, partial [Clostridia bacterium]|nr:carbohydrate-binding domain-containing protein [Clostridia bacterium]
MRKTTKLLLTALLAGSVLLASCASGGGETSAVPDVSGTESTPFVPPAETPATWSEFDLNTSWLETDPHIELTADNTRTEWPGAKLVGGDLYIKQPGTYVLSGTLNGQLFISVDKTTKVHLVFKGFTVHEDALSPILCERADKVVITLADGTENYVNDMHSGFVDGGTPPDGRNAGAIHAKMGLTINGNGSLTVNSTYRHGIVSNSNLRIVSGDITVNAVEEGLKGKESVSIR